MTPQEHESTTIHRRKARPTPRVIVAILAAFAAAGPSAWAEPTEGESSPAETDPWAPLRPLAGTWHGEVDGKLGTGTGVRRYELILGERYLMSRHSSVRLPQEKSPKGDQHEELGIFSFDSERQKIVWREFFIEGVVSRYVCETAPKKVVCTSEAVESGPGIRARLTLDITDRYRFEELYEIAWPGKELEAYFHIRWTRAPALDG